MTLLNPVSPFQWTFRRIMWATLVIVFVVFSFWLLYRFNQVIFLLLIAIMIGTVIRPSVAWLNRRGLSRTAGVILVYLLLLVLLIGFLLLLFPLILDQWATIAAAVPDYYQSLRKWTGDYPNQWIVRLGQYLPAIMPGLEPIDQTGAQRLASAGQVLDYVMSVGGSILSIAAVFLLAFRWTLDGPRMIQSILRLIPIGQRESISDLISAMETKVGYYIIGQSILCLVIGILALIAYLIIGLPNALVLALMAGVLEAVPMVGPLLGAIPAAVIALSISPTKLIWVIVATLAIQQIENSVLVPRVMRKAVGVNPFVSLLGIYAFSAIFGIAGALMAIPMAAIIQLIMDRFIFQQATLDSEVSSGRDFASRLRYEAQDLAQDLRKQARLKKYGTENWVKHNDRVMDEIEVIATDLDTLLAQVHNSGSP